MIDRARELISRQLDGIASDEERAELDLLIAGSPEIAAAFARASLLDHALDRHFREGRAASDIAEQIRRAARRPSRWKRWALAAGILFAISAMYLLVRSDGDMPSVAGVRLNAGDVVRNEATLEWPGEATRIDLRKGGILKVLVPKEGKRLELKAGTLEAVVAPQKSPLVIVTPLAEAEVLGTRFTLSSGPGGTRLDVKEGRVRLTRADKSAVEVGAGQYAVSIPGHEKRFLELRRDLHASGYFSKDKVPYHSIETLIVDAPDYGHLTTSETFSYWLWLEAAHGRISGDWNGFNEAWKKMEEVLIPTAADQPTNRFLQPATHVAERDHPEQYPVPLESARAGADPVAAQLRAAWGSDDLYGMHWLVDVDNWYGYGRRGDRKSRLSLINTFQRGPRESVWETIPHPSWEDFGAGGPNGFLDLFITQPNTPRQWRYTCAPDADARAIQAAAWAARWVREQGRDPLQVLPLRKAAQMGDSLRYALRDKYFRAAPHGLFAWSYAWGGSLDLNSPWAWRTGSDGIHAGYQNPFAAWALTQPEFKAPSGDGAREWTASVARQIEFLRGLQSVEGAIGGGASVKPDGSLEFDAHPVFLDPPSNEWFGWQAWLMDRVAQYVLVSGDARARELVTKWAGWVKRVVTLNSDGTYVIPSTLRWTGAPPELRVTVADQTQDVGIAAALARALLYHAADAKDESAKALARELLDRMWSLYRDDRGVSNPEARPDYARFLEKVFVPQGWSGRTASGEEIKPGITFLDLRSKYRRDPAFAALRKGESPVFRYHRFWAQVEVALAHAEYARLFR